MNDPCPESPGRFVFSAAADALGECDILFHPARPGEPGTGAVQSVCVDLDDWHALPEMRLILAEVVDHPSLFPFMLDNMYGGIYGPFWLKVAVEICTAAYMIGMIQDTGVLNVVRYLASQPELQQAVSAARRFGAPPLEVFMIVEEKL